MYTQLLTDIGAILQAIPEVASHSHVPKTDNQVFPYVYYRPAGYTNRFETTTENYKIYRFELVVYVGTNGTTMDNAFGVVLPAVVDAIIAAFDAAWDGGTVAGHRVTVNVDSADGWEVQDYQNGQVAIAPLSLEIKMLSTT